MIFPEMTAEERVRVRRAMADSFGRTFIDIFSMGDFRRRRAWSAPAGPGWEALQATRAEGKGASSFAATWPVGGGAGALKRARHRSRRALPAGEATPGSEAPTSRT